MWPATGSTSLKSWSDRRLIWDKLLASFGRASCAMTRPVRKRNVSGSNFLGYDDLVGQLRATLDYFPAARVFSFGAITAILAGLLILIGPVDYWLSVRWLRRPSFSWTFTGVTLLATCIGLVWLHNVSRPKSCCSTRRKSWTSYHAETIAGRFLDSHIFEPRANDRCLHGLYA